MRDIDIKFAKLISLLLNPFIVITFTLVLGNYIWVKDNQGPLIFVIIIMIFLPLIIYTFKLIHVFGLKKNILIFKNLKKSERDSILISILFIDVIAILILNYLSEGYWMLNAIVGFILVASLYLANRFIDKVSIHTAIITFSIFYLVDKLGNEFSLFLVILPVIIWSRMKLHKHTWLQLYLGIVIGMMLGLLSWTIK